MKVEVTIAQKKPERVRANEIKIGTFCWMGGIQDAEHLCFRGVDFMYEVQSGYAHPLHLCASKYFPLKQGVTIILEISE